MRSGRPLLASASANGTVRLWDPTTGTPVGRPLRGHSSGVYALAFGIDAAGRPLLACAGADGTVTLWDPATGASVDHPLRGHSSEVNAVAFGIDAAGRPLLASGGADRTVRLWDPATGAAIVTLLRRTSLRAVATYGTQLAIADLEGVTLVEVVDSAG